MSTNFKFCLFAFTVPLILFSCAAPQGNTAVTLPPSASTSTLTPIPLAASNTPTPKSVPKQNDLIFVEFFAVT